MSMETGMVDLEKIRESTEGYAIGVPWEEEQKNETDQGTWHKGAAIVAMKGQPCTGKSRWAKTLAQFLECSILVQDDILPCLKKLKFSSISLDDTSFEAICRSALTLLKLNLRVVIDSPLSERAHLDRLIQVSETTGVPLVIVECKPRNKYQWRAWLDELVAGNVSSEDGLTVDDVDRLLETEDGSSGYDVGDVSLLVVDTTATIENYHIHFAVEELLHSPGVHHQELPQWRPEILQQKDYSSSEPKEQPHVKDEEQIYTRYLIFQFGNNWRDEESIKICGRCQEPISGSIYNCNQYKVLLHKSCAESPKNLVILPGQNPPFLQEQNGLSEYLFPETDSCFRCAEANKSFSDSCDECLFQSHLKSGLLPTVLRHECHEEHPLFLRITSVSDGTAHFTVYLCDACGEYGHYMWYFCDACNFKCHVKCAFLQKIVELPYHRHSLNMNWYEEYEEYDELVCNACEKTRDPKYWIYYCDQCEFACHLNCETLLKLN